MTSSRSEGGAALASADAAVFAHAEALARCALDVLARLYPHKLDHLILAADDPALPSEIHPVFDGCFDWHSSVHMHWSLLRLRRLRPGLSCADEIAARFDARFEPARVARELAYLETPGRGAFERPYGWAWLLRLQAELEQQAEGGEGAGGPGRWAAALRPLAIAIAGRLTRFLDAGRYPVRAGTHANSAFAMLLALDYASQAGDAALAEAVRGAARRWFRFDRAYPADYEPSGTDFLSPGLCEARLMQRLEGDGFAAWWQAFQPPATGLARWMQPATVDDRLDGQLVHLDGLNLSRAWCLRGLAGRDSPQRGSFDAAALAHWQAAWPHVTGGDFVATHWLVSFALLR